MEKIIIIGAGQAAAHAADTLRREGFEGTLSIISDEDKVFYERPPLSKAVLAGEQDPHELQLFSDEAIEAMEISWYKPDRATKIDRQAQTVSLKSGKALAYDKLLIATGSRPNVPVKAWNEIPYLYTLRTIADSQKLGDQFEKGKRLALIGGGWIGLEVAATARQQGLEVDVFELAPRLCQRSVTEEVSAFLYKMHTDKGTNIHLDCGPIDIEEGENGHPLLTVAGKDYPVDMVIVGAGAKIATELAVEAGLEVKDGIVVDCTGQTSDPHIFAAGDVAIHPHPLLGFCTQSWANAQQQGAITAKHMLGIEGAEAYLEAPWIWSDQYDFNIQMLGFPLEGGCRVVKRETSPTQLSYIYLDDKGRARSIVAINDPRIIGIGRRWMRAKMEDLPAEKLADSQFNVMSLRPPR